MPPAADHRGHVHRHRSIVPDGGPGAVQRNCLLHRRLPSPNVAGVGLEYYCTFEETQMARATRTAITLLGTSILVGIIAAGCGGGNDNPGTVTAGGGGSSSTGGAATTTGGKANGGA